METLKLCAIAVLMACCSTPAGAGTVKEMEALQPNSTYACQIERLSVSILSSRAQWNVGEPRPADAWLSIVFGDQISPGSEFSVERNKISKPSETEITIQQITSGNGRFLSFNGALGRGTLSASVLSAGVMTPVRMNWEGLSQGLHFDAFMYCEKTEQG